jgi:hypothetical protein
LFWPVFWQSKFNNQSISDIVSVGAFPALLGKPLPDLSHMLQLLAMIERGRPRHIATFGSIATVFFDFFQGNSSQQQPSGKKGRHYGEWQPPLCCQDSRGRG